MNRFTKVALLSIIVLLASSCADRKNLSPIPTIKEETKKEIAKPVSCRNAKRDIAILEDEKASVGKQVLSGVRSVFPIAAVAGILMGDYSDRAKVATGIYNSDIEEKITQIKKQCGASGRIAG